MELQGCPAGDVPSRVLSQGCVLKGAGPRISHSFAQDGVSFQPGEAQVHSREHVGHLAGEVRLHAVSQAVLTRDRRVRRKGWNQRKDRKLAGKTGRAEFISARKLTVNTDGGRSHCRFPPTLDLTRQLSFVVYFNRVKGQRGLVSVGVEGRCQGAIVHGAPGNARCRGTVLNLADDLLVGAEPEQGSPGRHADTETLNAPR